MPSRIRLLVLCGVIVFVYPFFTFAKTYPDGTLIRVRGDIKVYLINENKKEWIESIEEFNSRNLKWSKVKIVSKKEAAAIENKETTSESTAPTPSPKLNPNAANPSPSASSIPTPPVPAKVNINLPAPDYIRADWLISQITANYGRIGQKIIFKYSDKVVDKVENFRLYEKRPNDKYFSKIADFEKIISTTCEGLSINGEWMMTEAAPNQCGYWAIQRITPPGGRGTTAYRPAANYSEGEYSYYVAGLDKDGLETRPSSEVKLVFLTTVGIFSPADNKEVTEIYPAFKWSVAGGWPAGITADYSIVISDDKNSQNPFWIKTLKTLAGKSDEAFVYNGPGLNPAKKYKVYIYGHYRKSEYDPDYISIPLTIPEFWIKSSGWQVSLSNILKALLLWPIRSLR